MKIRGPRGTFVKTIDRCCVICDGPSKSDRKCCSKECLSKFRTGRRMGNYRAARTVLNGYVWIKPDPTLRRSIQEHRWVMEQHLGRKLDGKEVVHHKNGVRDDNRIENLELIPCQGIHMRTHHHAPNSKVSDDDARELVAQFRGGVKRAVLAEKYGICKEQVSRIASGKTRRNVD